MLVIIHHVALHIPLEETYISRLFPNLVLRSISLAGHEAVFIFFVVSGFLITSNALVRWGALNSIRLRDFYLRRASRILPSLSALILILSILHLAHVEHFILPVPYQTLSGAIASAFGLYLNWYEALTGYLPANWDVLWSLSIEEMFYLVFPLVCLALGTSRRLAGFFLIFALSLPISYTLVSGGQIWKDKAYLPGMAAIAAGISSAILAHRFRLVPLTAILALELVGWLGMAVVLCLNGLVWTVLGPGTLLLLTISTASLLFSYHQPSNRGYVFGLKWLGSLGRLSYEVYLIHMFVVWPIVDLDGSISVGESWRFLWYLPAVGFSWLIGWLVAKYFSVPVEKWIRGRWANQVN